MVKADALKSEVITGTVGSEETMMQFFLVSSSVVPLVKCFLPTITFDYVCGGSGFFFRGMLRSFFFFFFAFDMMRSFILIFTHP